MIAVTIEQPSTLTDVIGQVKEAFDQCFPDKIPFQIGKQYREDFGVGDGPKVLFVPEAEGGQITDPIEMGNAASYIHACDVYVRGFEGVDNDLTRFDNVYGITNALVGAICVAATGKLKFGKASDDSPTKTNAYGAGVSFSFTYRRDILQWAALRAIKFGGPSVLASGIKIDPKATPKE
jgi:hypothetical protein